LLVVRAALVVTMTAAPSIARAQDTVSIEADLMFYGDDTEFHGPFRDGETLFGAAGWLAAVCRLNDRASVSLGVFGDHRYGGDGFERAVPIASLAIGTARSLLTIGTMPLRRATPAAPDRDGPHDLLPPIQRDNLTFARPYQAGLQWTASGSRGTHDSWLNWQRLNTEAHRERFDAGLNTRARLAPAFALGVQIHVVHEGGQLFASGPVGDSAAYAAGALLEGKWGPLDLASIEAWGALARYVPDREVPADSLTGRGFFARAAGARAGWRGHLIVWRGRDFVKDEGDPNYQSVRLDGSRYGPTRDYSEAGLARRFSPAQEVIVDVSYRVHRVEGNYDYSFRIIANANLVWKLK
jgi:hypothetical protein